MKLLVKVQGTFLYSHKQPGLVTPELILTVTLQRVAIGSRHLSPAQ